MKRRDFLAALAISPTTTLAKQENDNNGDTTITFDGHAMSLGLYSLTYTGRIHEHGRYCGGLQNPHNKEMWLFATKKIWNMDGGCRKTKTIIHKDGLDVRFVD